MKIIKRSGVLQGHYFQEEADILKRLDHPYIVKLAHHFRPKDKKYKDVLCLVMELVRGSTFAKVFAARNFNKRKRLRHPLPEDTARFYLSQLVAVIDYLHKEGIVYRDLKPDNFMLREDGNICLLDFGVSFQLKRVLQRMGTRIGADGFKAPEMLTSKNQGYGKEVDWWNLGIVAYMLLSGKHPFRSLFGGKLDIRIAKILDKQKANLHTSAAARRISNPSPSSSSS
eukprot:CAMPEP_0175180306 /NCGR_PEP_ID=MMETSP0087-20121206/35990_1 /TAXON_ID=136419 /ORGANISM="Unknown Unknown, Strain D1" /LENGTH=226 /DNA_ID=CAMNT_0016472623 /DNA_START=26 /DNA_END=703 /DNA_ORIENTATION=+